MKSAASTKTAKARKAVATPVQPLIALDNADSAIAFAYDGMMGGGLPPALAKAKLEAFYAKYPRRTLRKGEKDTVALVKEARESRDRR